MTTQERDALALNTVGLIGQAVQVFESLVDFKPIPDSVMTEVEAEVKLIGGGSL